MEKNFFRSVGAILCAATLFTTGCQKRVILMSPGEDDLVVLNGCVVSACNYLAAVKATHSLEQNFWAKILLVRFENHPAGHAYCVWETEGTVYGYDRNSGGFPIPVYTRDPRSIAIVLAMELSKYLDETLSVSSADFIDANEAELYSYSPINLKGESPVITLLTSAPIPPRPHLGKDLETSQ